MIRLDPSRLHLFSMDGLHLLMGHRGGLYRIDETIFDALSEDGKFLSGNELEKIREDLAYIDSLEGGREDCAPQPDRRVRALCLNLTDDCNMNCIYCFTKRRKITHPSLMESSTAAASIEFLFRHSHARAPLQVDFFGGEPLLNFDVLQRTVSYAKKKAGSEGRKIRFTVTTNGSLLDRDITAYLNGENFQVILSIDGSPELHDNQRPFQGGAPSWNKVFPRIKEFLESRCHENYYIRATFTPHSLALEKTACRFIEQGMTNFSLEPARGALSEPWSIKEEHLPVIIEEYECLARFAANSYKRGKPFNLFHFNIFNDPPLCITRRLSGCGAGIEYLSIGPGGEIFPCHQLQGEPQFFMGRVFDEEIPPGFESTRSLFVESQLLKKEECRTCWARFYCGGGCHANNFFAWNDILKPDRLGCRLQKKRLECALWIMAQK